MSDFDHNKDYYKILWVSEDTPTDEIKKAFKKLALKYHPDKKWWNQEKFKEINEAFQTIWNEKKRQQYDSVRKWWFWWFDNIGWFWWWWFGSGWVDIDLWDLLWWFFGWGTSSNRNKNWPAKWKDIVLNIKVDFIDAYKWITKTFKYKKMVSCSDCWWKWISKESQKNVCSVCNGSWVMTNVKNTPFGAMQMQTTCTNCQWTWYTDSKPCTKCNWSGYNEIEKETTVNIPAWMNSWEYIKIPWMGNDWRNWWSNWDLYIKINITWLKDFKREWNHLILETDIDVYQAVLWWDITVNHPEWKMKITIPKWLQVWEMITVAWKWFGKKWLFSNRWDFIIIPNIKIPKKLTKESEKKWKELSSWK